MRALASTAAATALVMMMTGCDGGDGDETSSPAQIYIAAVRSVAAEIPTEDPEKLPIVYVVSSGEQPFGAEVQAEVASALNEEADVLFADERDEALDVDEPNEPVRDGGRLLAIEPIDDAENGTGDTVELQIEIYRSNEEWSRRVVTFGRSGADWSVTSSSVVEVGAAGDADDGDGSDATASMPTAPASSSPASSP